MIKFNKNYKNRKFNQKKDFKNTFHKVIINMKC